MTDLGYYAAKIEECRRLLESSPDQLYRDVYQAMADEFAEKYAALRRRSAERVAAAPSPLLFQVVPPTLPEPAVPSAADLPDHRAGGYEAKPDRRRRKRDTALGLGPV